MQPAATSVTSTELADERTDLALERTAMAVSRTLMAWIRTGLALIGFGFTIYKVIKVTAEASELGLEVDSAKRLGLALIALGTASVGFGVFEYVDAMSRLSSLSRTRRKRWNFSLALSVMIMLLGAFLFITILMHMDVF